jgi:hypothetical protein
MLNLTVIAVLGTAMFLFQESLEKIAHIELLGPKGWIVRTTISSSRTSVQAFYMSSTCEQTNW